MLKPSEKVPLSAIRLGELLQQAGMDADPADFRRFGSARKLYNFNIDNLDAY